MTVDSNDRYERRRKTIPRDAPCKAASAHNVRRISPTASRRVHLLCRFGARGTGRWRHVGTTSVLPGAQCWMGRLNVLHVGKHRPEAVRLCTQIGRRMTHSSPKPPCEAPAARTHTSTTRASGNEPNPHHHFPTPPCLTIVRSRLPWSMIRCRSISHDRPSVRYNASTDQPFGQNRLILRAVSPCLSLPLDA